jgi:hypothetical protein
MDVTYLSNAGAIAEAQKKIIKKQLLLETPISKER